MIKLARFAFFLAAIVLTTAAAAQSTDETVLAKLNPKVDTTMAGYNEGDYKKFFTEFVPMEGVTTEQMFKMLYLDMYKPQFGNYVSRELIAAETVALPDQDMALVVYKAKFEKNESVKLSLNFMKVEGDFKIQQVVIAAMPPEAPAAP